MYTGYIDSNKDTYTQDTQTVIQIHVHRIHIQQYRYMYTGYIYSNTDTYTQDTYEVSQKNINTGYRQTRTEKLNQTN